MRAGAFLKRQYVQLHSINFCKRYAHTDRVRIGCSSGFWGDTPTAVPQLIYGGNIKYLVSDYLSEVTMSLLFAARSKNPQLGFTPDFLESLAPHLKQIKKQDIKVITNGGGINPKACAEMLKGLAKKQDTDLKIAYVLGDDLMHKREELQKEGVKEMFSGQEFPSTVNSMNAYYGSGPIVKALEMGADVVITGRSTDSALALAPLMYEFGWKDTDFDKLAAGSLAGHLIECGCQCTGGNYTDWQTVPNFDNLGFPIAEVSPTGEMIITKPDNTGGVLTVGSVGEQMLYEIGDPAAYQLPDVIADFSQVKMQEMNNGVKVWGAKGRPPTTNFKISATYLDGYKATGVVKIVGRNSVEKCRVMADSIFKRTRGILSKLKMADFEKTHVQVLGAEESYGANAVNPSKFTREAVVCMSAQHLDKKALQIWAKEIAAIGTGGTPGITGAVGGRPKPTPCLKLFSFLHPKQQMDASIHLNDQTADYSAPIFEESTEEVKAENKVVKEVCLPTGSNSYRLEELAFTRSGDKGDSCNIGVIARHPAFLPYIRQHLSVEKVTEHFQHVFEGDGIPRVHRFDCDGIHAVNFLLESALGGGGIASLRPDSQGKAYGQILGDIRLCNLPSKETIMENSEIDC